MPTKPKSGETIDPARRYRIRFSKTITDGDGRKYVPRAGQSVTVSGRILSTIQSDVDSYEAV